MAALPARKPDAPTPDSRSRRGRRVGWYVLLIALLILASLVLWSGRAGGGG